MGFSVKLAPGVRVRASSRGVRTSLGPRAARVHVGAGRTGFSSGVGPVGFYTSIGGSHNRSRARAGGGTAAANRQLATAARAAAAEEKADEARRLADALTAVLDVHRADFPPADRPIAPPPPPVDVAAIRARHVAEARAATSVFARAERKAALAEAERRTQIDVANQQQVYASQERAWQQALDAQWELLVGNDPDTVLAALAEAFEDNEAAAAAVGVDSSEVTLVVLVPSASAVPERRPTTTPAGNLSLKKFTKRETADLYKLLVCGHALVTVKEAFAVAPRITAARIVALRASEPNAYGAIRPEVLLAARFDRAALDGIQWADADAVRIVNDAATERVLVEKGATSGLTPLNLNGEPDLAALVATVDFEDLLAA
jgi:hypothetical protein